MEYVQCLAEEDPRMERRILVLSAAALLVPLSAWAGFPAQNLPAPALGDAGLIALGVGLLGAGVAFLRKR